MSDEAGHDQPSVYCHDCNHQWQIEGDEGSLCPACMSPSIEVVIPENNPDYFYYRQLATDVATARSAPAHEPNTSETGRQGGAPDGAQEGAQDGAREGASSETNGSTPRSDDDPFARLTLRFTSLPRVTVVTLANGNTPAPAAEPSRPGHVGGMQFVPFLSLFPVAPPPTGNNTPPEQQTAQQHDHHQQQQQQPGRPAGAPQPGEERVYQQQQQQQQREHQHQHHHQQQHERHYEHHQQQHPALPPLPPMLPLGVVVSLLTSLINPAAAPDLGFLGDAVFSQEALDRIITQLRDQEPITGGAPPASQAALDRLRMQALDDKMLARMGCDSNNNKGDREEEGGKARCVVCVDDMCRGEEVAVLPCEHFFHGECIVPWLKVHNTCPVCRGSVEVEVDGEEEGKAAKGGADSMDCPS